MEGVHGGEAATDTDERLRALIRDIPDFPQPGIVFKDITPLMADREALALAVQGLAEYARPLDVRLRDRRRGPRLPAR